MAGNTGEVERVLSALDISAEDVQAVVKLLVATAHGREEFLARRVQGGMTGSTVKPLPTAETVLLLAQRMDGLEQTMKGVSERLDKVLAALERK